MTDGELLAEYARNGSEQAFAELVERHAGMVHATCLGLLGDRHAAEDAAQATFLVLARKARRLPAGTVLSGWLFRTAQYAARDARKLGERRRAREREAAEMSARQAGTRSVPRAELRPLLLEALGRLPARERGAVVLCHLEGRSRAEAARELGCPEETVHTRLRRALARLRARLARRGAELPAAALGALLAESAAGGAPAALVASIQAACLGKAAASTSALSITEGAMKAMFWVKVKFAAALLAGAAVVGAGTPIAVHAASGGQEQEQKPPFYPDRFDLTYYLDAQGRKHPVKTIEDWKKRRAHIFANAALVMGPLPGPEKKVPLDIKVESTTTLGDGITFKKITYAAEKGDRVPARLLIPKGLKGKAPAMLCLHWTDWKGGGAKLTYGGRAYARELAKRGYVTIAPDYPYFGENKSDPYKLGYASGTIEAIWNHMRAVDLLQSLPEVDPERIGSIGFSLGAHSSAFVAAFDPRIKAVVTGAGLGPMIRYGGKGDANVVRVWSQLCFMPLVQKQYGKDLAKLPFDLPELVGAMAPRHLYIHAPRQDAGWTPESVDELVEAAKPIYKLHGAEDRLLVVHPEGRHDFPNDARLKAYEFLDGVLKEPAGGKKPPVKIEFPPVEKLPEIKELPDPFLMMSGKRVATLADWKQRREEIKAMLLYYQYGKMPPPPENLAAEVTSNRKTRRHVRLSMGPGKKLELEVRISIPLGKGPFPAIVKPEHYSGSSGSEAARRGYIVAQYYNLGLDPDKKDTVGPAQAAYPDYDWGTIAVWAWGGMRVIDYLFTLPEVDKKKIAVTGHSRGGKTALLIGAFDERVALTVPNASGCGGAECYRFVNHYGALKLPFPLAGRSYETLEGVCGFTHWFHPRLRQFGRKESRLPYDQHTVMALVAPRALISVNAMQDRCVDPLASQFAHQAVQPVFDWLGAGQKIGLHFREGGHMQGPEDWAALLDFADMVFFGKKPAGGRRFDKLPFPKEKPHFSWKAPSKSKPAVKEGTK